MSRQDDFRLTFWGVRGSRPVSGGSYQKYGGNTACVEVSIGEHSKIIFDGGTGIVNLGTQLAGTPGALSADIFLSHVHWDHVWGLPYFTPFRTKGNKFRLFGEMKEHQSVREQVAHVLQAPFFPLELKDIEGQLEFCHVSSGDTVDLANGVTVRVTHNRHPNGSLSYRLEHSGRSCCYITDTEHCPETSRRLRYFARESDVVIYDANYTDMEYDGQGGGMSRHGWGHSTWQEGVRLVKSARAKTLVVFHHDPERTDDELDEIGRQARREYKDCVVAQ